MARHGRSVPLFVRRRSYLRLARAYDDLMRAYTALAADRDGLAALVPPSEQETAEWEEPVWCRTQEIPIITELGLPPEKAAALVHRGGMLSDPAGSWGLRAGNSG